jgi:hypothetical protein
MGEQRMDFFHAAAGLGDRQPTRDRRGGLVALVAILVLTSCKEPALPAPNTGQRARDTCPSIEDATYFFPTGALIPDDASMDRAQRLALSGYWLAARTKSLSCGDVPESYRMFWGGGFGTTPIIVTVSGNQAEAVEFLAPNQNLHSIKGKTSLAVSAADLEQLRLQIDQSTFWTAKPFSDLEGEGTIWFIEARRGASYKTVTRVAPEPALMEAARLMVRLSGHLLPEGMTTP